LRDRAKELEVSFEGTTSRLFDTARTGRFRHPVPGPALRRDLVRVLAAAWGAVAVGAVVLAVRYPNLPQTVVLYRPPWADAPIIGARSFVTVGRIALMGVGQLGAATAMVFASRAARAWERFWTWLGLVAGVKTLLECASFVLPQGSTLERALTFVTIAVVALFGLTAVRWWRRGELQAPPRLEGRPRVWLLAALALWAAFAVAPSVN
jgi:hypothetical protein